VTLAVRAARGACETLADVVTTQLRVWEWAGPAGIIISSALFSAAAESETAWALINSYSTILATSI
jgi:hypothetical protein